MQLSWIGQLCRFTVPLVCAVRCVCCINTSAVVAKNIVCSLVVRLRFFAWKKWQGKRGWRCSDCIMVADWLVYCSQLNSTTELWDFLLSPAKPFINRPQQRITPSNFIVVSDLCGGWKIAATNCIGWRRLRRSLHNWESIFISLCVGVDRMRMYIYSRYSSAGAPCKDG